MKRVLGAASAMFLAGCGGAANTAATAGNAGAGQTTPAAENAAGGALAESAARDAAPPRDNLAQGYDPNAGLERARQMQSFVDNGGIPGCFDPSLSGRERAVAERLGGVPCGNATAQRSSARGGVDTWEGEYDADVDGGSGSITIRRANGANRYSVSFGIGGPNGCSGGIEGPGIASGDRLTFTSAEPEVDVDQCRIVLRRQGRSLAIEPEGGCYYWHGRACAFDGTARRTR